MEYFYRSTAGFVMNYDEFESLGRESSKSDFNCFSRDKF